jgi:aspartate carbamoyltransferase catalytic subunit
MEIAFSVADSTQSAVLQQVSNGVHIRMAVLFHLLVGAEPGVLPSQAGDPPARGGEAISA